jgi:hypothetical protein
MNASQIKYDESKTLPLAQQYELLRNEMLVHIKQINTLELGAAISIGATYAFLITHKTDVPCWGMWFIPQILILLFGIRCVAHTWEMKRIGEFLLTIEETAKNQSDSFLGWEHFKKSGRHWLHDWVTMTISAFIWIAAFVVTLISSLCLLK